MKNELETKNNLMIAAKEEFMQLGFQKASLRNICKNAGVTTGALYFFFRDKEDLFGSLVRDVAQDVRSIIMNHVEIERSMYRENSSHKEITIDGVSQSKDFVRYMYAHKDEFILILTKSQGSEYENFIDEMIGLMEKHSSLFVKEILGEEFEATRFSQYSYHWFAHIEVMSFAQLLTHGLTLGEALEQSEIIAHFLAGGWVSMMKK